MSANRTWDRRYLAVSTSLDGTDTFPLLASIKPVVVGEEYRAGPEGNDEAAAPFRFGNLVGSEEASFHELPQVRSQLLLLDLRRIFEHDEPAEPFGT